MAKEIRNPNDEGDGRRALCSDLGLRASFGFRHSDFVVNALELERCADDFGQTEAQLLRHERFETVAIAIGGVEIIHCATYLPAWSSSAMRPSLSATDREMPPTSALAIEAV